MNFNQENIDIIYNFENGKYTVYSKYIKIEGCHLILEDGNIVPTSPEQTDFEAILQGGVYVLDEESDMFANVIVTENENGDVLLKPDYAHQKIVNLPSDINFNIELNEEDT